MAIMARRFMLLLMLVCLLSACGNQEELAQVRFEDAVFVEQQGLQDVAEKLYRKVVTDFPETAVAKEATLQLERIEKERARLRLLKEEATDLLQRVATFFDGYQQMYQKLPSSFDEVDGSDYFFDSDYLQEIVPEGFSLIVLINPEQGEYVNWVIKEGMDVAAGRKAGAATLVSMPTVELEKRLQHRTDLQQKGRIFWGVLGKMGPH